MSSYGGELSENNRRVFVDHLPKYKYGDKEKISWRESIGYSVKFIYDDTDGEFEIIDYRNKYLKLKYKNKIDNMNVSQFLYGNLGAFIGRFAYDHTIEVGSIIQNKKGGEILILEQIRSGKNNTRGYQYKCLKCNNIDNISEFHLKNEKGCGVCFGSKTLRDYNDLWTTAPHVAKLLWNEEEGYKYRRNSNKKTDWRCPNCNFKIKNMEVSKVSNYGLPCKRCGDGISYPEKFMFNVLYQLGIEFQCHVMFDWSKEFKNEKLRKYKEYDFYIPESNCIAETHGSQHYREGFDRTYEKARSLEDEQENDRVKKEMALINGIQNYIVVDARYSEMEWIRNSILNSELSTLFDLGNIDWLKCHEYACNSLVKVVCDLWNKGITNSGQIANLTKITRTTVINYLKQGTKIQLCNYNAKDEMRKTGSNHGKINGKKHAKPVVQLTQDNQFIATYETAKEAYRQTGVNFGNISKACKKGSGMVQGFKWMLKENWDEYLISINKLEGREEESDG